MTRALLVSFLLGLLPAAAESPRNATSGPEPGTRPAASLPELPRVTAELKDLTLEDAARRLAEITGLGVMVPSRPIPPAEGRRVPKPTFPPLDFNRRASFSWRDTPLAEALREFCRTYGCSLTADYRGNLLVTSTPLREGLNVELAGHTVSVTGVSFTDSRTVDDDGQLVARRYLQLQFAVRARTQHVAHIYGLENVRVEDQLGRDLLDRANLPGVLAPARVGAFPDERLQTVRYEWPYPHPERLRLIEGDLVLYRQVMPGNLELTIPALGQTSEIKEANEVQCQLVQVDPQQTGFRATLRVVSPQNIGVLFSGQGVAELVMTDGTRRAVLISSLGWGSSDGWRSNDYSLQVPNLTERPARLSLRFIRQAFPEQRTHFRIANYPVRLRTGPEPLTPAPRSPAPTKPPAKKPSASTQGGKR